MNLEEIMKADIKESGNTHVARQNGYGDLIDNRMIDLRLYKKYSRPEWYIEFLEDQYLYLSYCVEFYKRQSRAFQRKVIKNGNYIEELENKLEEKE